MTISGNETNRQQERKPLWEAPRRVEKAREIDPFGYAGFDPSGKIRLTL